MTHRMSDHTARRGTGAGLARPRNTRRRAPVGLLAALLFAPALAVSPPAQAVGETTLVSVAPGGQQANDASGGGSISADGRYVAFGSGASNLVPGDTNDNWDGFVHDLRTGRTTRVSVASSGAQANDVSGGGSISADGRYVAFESGASNLVPGDTNENWDVFVHDLRTGQTTRVSVASSGAQANARSFGGSISAAGRYVAFSSSASNLVAGDTNRATDVFVHDLRTGQTTRVSVASNGAEANGGDDASLSADGRYVAFSSYADNLVPGDTNGKADVFVHDRRTGQTSRVSVASNGAQGNLASDHASISADGRYVVFISGATNLVPGDTDYGEHVFVHDRWSGQNTKASVVQETNGYVGTVATSADGRYVAYSSVTTSHGGGLDEIRVFVHDLRTGQATLMGGPIGGFGFHVVTPQALSADGRFVAFAAGSACEEECMSDVYVRDRLLDRSATADLAVTQTVSPSPFPPSSPITYTVNVVNNGPDTAGEVTLVDGPLRGSAVPSQGNCSDGAPMVCYLGSLAASAKATVTLTLPPRSIGTTRVYNAARVNAAPVDPNPANNKTGLHTRVAP